MKLSKISADKWLEKIKRNVKMKAIKKRELIYMKKWIIILLITLTLPTQIWSAVNGIGLKDDEYAHIFMAAYATDVCRQNNFEWWQTGLVILGASIAKESYDTKTTGFSTNDIGFSMSGYALSYLVNSLFSSMSSANKPAEKHMASTESTTSI